MKDYKDLANMEKPPTEPTFRDRLQAAQAVWPHLKPPWHPHLPGPEVAVSEALPPADGEMSAEEDYGFDVQGFLIVRGALNSEELDACNRLVDQGGVPADLCAHPVVVRYIEQLCGLAYHVDKPVTLVEQLGLHDTRPMVGGNEPRNPGRAYFHQGTSRFCQGVRAIWALEDIPPGAGGVILLPGSHNVNVPVPDVVLSGADTYLESLGMCLQPALQAGDLLLHASTLANGLRPWCHEDGSQRLATCDFISVFARPSDLSSDSLTEGGRVEALPWMSNLGPEERTVLGLEDTATGPAAPLLADGKRTWIDPDAHAAGRLYHPGVYNHHPAPSSTVDPIEFFYWELTGFLVVRNVIDLAWLKAANAAVEANLHHIDYESADKHRVEGGPRMRGGSRPGLAVAGLSDEDRQPFIKMLAHPALVHRLNWMLGGHFRAEAPGTVITTRRGGGGQILHGNGDPIYPNLNWWPYLYQNGRCYTGQVNVAWQLHDVTDQEGGFVVVPGSHHARYPLPSNDSGDPAGHKGVLHPQMKAGDLLFFMGGATTHGAWAWHSDLDRRCVLNAYWSKDMARMGWVNTRP
jgi:ectoine hydroxylase-related dioxygenase (phytanoyl-CoA dioxygenase family)